jgi:integration host factor subunit beta
MNITGSMTKAELVEEVSRVSDLTKKHSEVIVDTVFRSIIDALHRGEKIELRGFGSFRLRRREPRKGRNPKTGDKVDVPPKKVPYFKPGKELKELINKEPGPPPRRLAAPAGQTSRACRAGPAGPPRAFGRRRQAFAKRPCNDPANTSGHRGASPISPARRSRPIASSARRSRSADGDPLIVFRGTTCFVILNLFPYNSGHLMVVPRRHIASLGDATADELTELMELARRAEVALREAYAPHGLNLGINLGKAAGAGVLDHVHMHIVPRWNGDTNFMSVVGHDACPSRGAARRRPSGCGRFSTRLAGYRADDAPRLARTTSIGVQERALMTHRAVRRSTGLSEPSCRVRGRPHCAARAAAHRRGRRVPRVNWCAKPRRAA